MIDEARSQGQGRLGSVKHKTAWSRSTQPTVTPCQSQATAHFLSRVRSMISYHLKRCFARPAFCKWSGKFPSVWQIPPHSKEKHINKQYLIRRLPLLDISKHNLVTNLHGLCSVLWRLLFRVASAESLQTETCTPLPPPLFLLPLLLLCPSASYFSSSSSNPFLPFQVSGCISQIRNTFLAFAHLVASCEFFNFSFVFFRMCSSHSILDLPLPLAISTLFPYSSRSPIAIQPN